MFLADYAGCHRSELHIESLNSGFRRLHFAGSTHSSDLNNRNGKARRQSKSGRVLRDSFLESPMALQCRKSPPFAEPPPQIARPGPPPQVPKRIKCAGWKLSMTYCV